MILRTSSSHEEGVIRDWSINTKKFSGENGQVKKLHAVRLEWKQGNNGRPQMVEIPGSEFTLDVDLVLLALGFLGPEEGPIKDLGLKTDERSNVAADERYMSSLPGVFACGDAGCAQRGRRPCLRMSPPTALATSPTSPVTESGFMVSVVPTQISRSPETE